MLAEAPTARCLARCWYSCCALARHGSWNIRLVPPSGRLSQTGNVIFNNHRRRIQDFRQHHRRGFVLQVTLPPTNTNEVPRVLPTDAPESSRTISILQRIQWSSAQRFPMPSKVNSLRAIYRSQAKLLATSRAVKANP